MMQIPFRDGVVIDVPDHVGMLMRAHEIPTLELTYEQAMEQVDLMNTRVEVNRQADRLIGEHLKIYGGSG